MSGWKLSAAMLVKQIGKLGDTLAESLAAFDPETATEVDRDKLKAQLREVALRQAEARRAYAKEQKEVDDLAAQIANDEKAAERLIAKLETGGVDEATLTEFADNLESMKARLPAEQQDAAQAKELVDTLDEILRTIEQKLADFERHAQAAMRAIAQAKAEKERQELRTKQQAEMQNLRSGLGGASSALGALNKKAARLQVEADAAKTVADIGQKPLDRANAIEEARRIASGDAPAATESVADRLRRLSGKA